MRAGKFGAAVCFLTILVTCNMMTRPVKAKTATFAMLSFTNMSVNAPLFDIFGYSDAATWLAVQDLPLYTDIQANNTIDFFFGQSNCDGKVIRNNKAYSIPRMPHAKYVRQRL